MKEFTRQHRIRFSECDPAGIVFYPQYFVLFNDLLEAWLETLIDGGLNGLITTRRTGMPTVRLEADFRAVSKMGDDVTLVLGVSRLGQRSFQLVLSCVGADGTLRMSVLQSLVTTSLETHRAVPVPEDLRVGLAEYVIEQDATMAAATEDRAMGAQAS